jgi:hypothetical protein
MTEKLRHTRIAGIRDLRDTETDRQISPSCPTWIICTAIEDLLLFGPRDSE